MSALVARTKTAGGIGEGELGDGSEDIPHPTAGLTQRSRLERRLWVRAEAAEEPSHADLRVSRGPSSTGYHLAGSWKSTVRGRSTKPVATRTTSLLGWGTARPPPQLRP